MIVTIQLDDKVERDKLVISWLSDVLGGVLPDVVEKRGPGRPRKNKEPEPVIAEPVAVIEPGTVEIPTHPEEMATRRNLQAIAARGEPAPAIVEKSADGEPEVMHVTVYAPEAEVEEPVITSPALDADSFRALAMAYNKAKGVKALLEVLKRHGFGNIGAVTSDMYAVVAADLTL